jgi:hypothetical protein
MKKWLLFSFLVPVFMWAQSPFDGTWKVNPDNAQFGGKPEVRVLQNGMYSCKSCVPQYSVKADGTDQKVTGNPYLDTMNIKVVDDKKIERTWKKDGKVKGTETDTVSDDGNLLTADTDDMSAPNGKEVKSKVTMERVAKGPAGSHAASGTWKPKQVGGVTDEGLMFTYKSEGDTLKMSTPTGQSYTAKLDDKDVPFEGDPGVSTIAVKRINDNTIQETAKRNGKVLSITKLTSEGNTLKIDSQDKLHGTTVQLTATKQP